jgi:predicted ester cyclase
MADVQRRKKLIERAFAHYTPATLDVYLELYHPNARLHFLPRGLPQGREGSRLRDMLLLSAFPDAQVVFEDWIFDADKCAARFRFDATHLGEFMGIAPTNRRVSVTGITILRFEGDHVVERWSEMNYLGLLQALGMSPFP